MVKWDFSHLDDEKRKVGNGVRKVYGMSSKNESNTGDIKEFPTVINVVTDILVNISHQKIHHLYTEVRNYVKDLQGYGKDPVPFTAPLSFV